ncbi:MAG: histidine kinase dimerization/phosphoacceptor domain -containing protein [Methanobacteriota archaeon]
MIKIFLSENTALIREIYHRVKNNLSTIISLINLQMTSLPSESDVSHFQDLEARVRSMALVHESLFQAQNLSQVPTQSYIKSLVQYLIHIYKTRLLRSSDYWSFLN